MKERITPKDNIEIYNAFSNENTDKTDLLKWALCGKKYEDLEEQGLIVRLPCKVGDKVFSIYRDVYGDYTIKEDEVWHFNVIDKVYITTDYFEDGELEVDVFLTRAEAEKKLKELKGEE